MAREMRYGLLLYLRDQASRGIKNLRSEVVGLGRDLQRGFGAGLGGGFPRMFGGGVGGRIAQGLATRPGGAGGILSDILKGATGLALLPVRVLNAFASLIPGVGTIISGVVGTVANILQGVIGIVANIVGAILNVVIGLVQQVIRIVEGIIGTIAGLLGRLVKVAATVGLGIGAALAYAAYRGIQRNWKEAQLRAVFARRLGGAWKAAWEEVERVAVATPFSTEEIAQALVVLARADLRDPAQYLELLADAAVGAGASLAELADLFVQVQARGEDLGRARMRLFQLGIPAETVQRISTVADLAAVLRQRFGGVAREVDRLKPLDNVFEQMGLALRDLTAPLAEMLVPALNRVAEWLERIRQSPAFTRLIQQVKDLGQGILVWVEEKLTWLTTREWSFENLKRGLQELWQTAIPALGDLLKAAFQAAVDYAQVLFAQLWHSVGQGLVGTVQQGLAQIGQALTRAGSEMVGAAIEDAARQRYEEFQAWLPEKERVPWEKAGPRERARHLFEAQAPRVVDILTDARARAQFAQTAAGRGLEQVGKGADAGADASAAALQQAASALGGTIAGGGATAFPADLDALRRQAEAAGPFGHAAPTPEQMGLMERVSELMDVQRMLREQGHGELAQGMEGRIQGLLQRVNQLQQQQGQSAQSLTQTVFEVIAGDLTLIQGMTQLYRQLRSQLAELRNEQRAQHQRIRNLARART